MLLEVVIAVLTQYDMCFVNNQIKVLENQQEKKKILLTQYFGWSLCTVDLVHYTRVSGNILSKICNHLNFVLASYFCVKDLR